MYSPKQNTYNIPSKIQETLWKGYKEQKSQRVGQSAMGHCLLDTGWLCTQHLTASVTAAAQDPPTNITSLTLHL